MEILHQKRENLYNKLDFVNKLDDKLIRTKTYYLRNVTKEGKRNYVYF